MDQFETMPDLEDKAEEWKKLEPVFGVKVFLTLLYSIILVLGIVGNIITIRVTQVLQRNGYLQKNVTDHMVSLACSDLLVLLIGMPMELYTATWFPFTSAIGHVSCKLYNFLFEACSYATILNVATFCFERYLAICHPFRYKALAGSRTIKLIIFAWLSATLVALPLLLTTGTESHVLKPESQNQTLTFCTNLAQHYGLYRASMFVAFIVYIVVLGGVAFMCKKMILVLRAPMGPMETGAGGISKHESAQLKASRKQTILFLGLIVGALFICWVPNQVRRLMTAVLPIPEWTVSTIRAYVSLHPVADTFFYLSSVLNPFLYNLSSRQFRSRFLQALRCRLNVEHINKRTLESARASQPSARSLRPLLHKSLRKSKPPEQSTPQPENAQEIPKSVSSQTSETGI